MSTKETTRVCPRRRWRIVPVFGAGRLRLCVSRGIGVVSCGKTPPPGERLLRVIRARNVSDGFHLHHKLMGW